MSTPSDHPPSGQPPAESTAGGAWASSEAGGGQAPEPGPPAERHRPWAWIAACVVLLVVAGGVAIWALGLQSDLDDQKDQTAQAQQEAAQAGDAVDELSAEVDDITQSVSDAGEDAQQNLQAALDELRDKLAELRDQLTQAAEDAGAADAAPTP